MNWKVDFSGDPIDTQSDWKLSSINDNFVNAYFHTILKTMGLSHASLYNQ